MKCIYKTNENPKELVKYFSDSDVVIESIFENRKIRFTQPAALNDPLEFNPTLIFGESVKNVHNPYEFNNKRLPSIELFSRIQLIESVINNFGILSLSSEIDSFDMWNLYSNGHKGFMIQFKDDFNENPCLRSKGDGKIYKIGKVEYVDAYRIKINKILSHKNFHDFEYIYETVFFSKNNRWESENEYRIVRKLIDFDEFNPQNKVHRNQSSIYLSDFSFDCIDSIAFGAQMSLEKKMKIIKACEGNDINYFQAIIIRDKLDRFGKMGCVEYLPVSYDGEIKAKNLKK